MSKKGEAPAFLFDVDAWLTSVKIAMMTAEQERGYLRLLLYQWKDPHCRLPDDNAVLAKLSMMNEGWLNGGSVLVRACFTVDGGFLQNERLLQERARWDRWKKKSSEGGKRSGEARRKKGLMKGGLRVVEPRSKHEKENGNKKEKKKGNGKENGLGASRLGDSPPNCFEGGESERGELMPSWMDEFYLKFREGWNECYPGQDYNDNRKDFDFVALAAIQNNKSLTAENWSIACAHYFATPQNLHTLADLAKRYSTFLAHALDRFNKPVRGNGQMTDRENRTIAAANRVIGRLNSGELVIPRKDS